MTYPKNGLPLLVLLLMCSAIQLSMSWSDTGDNYGILTYDDYAVEQDQDSPALHSVPGENPIWESFNQWSCFPTESVEIGCFDEKTDALWETSDPEERDGRGYFSVMHIEHNSIIYRVERSVWIDPEKCLEEVAEIKGLMKEQDGICIFAAQLPSLEQAQPSFDGVMQTWVYYGVKTKAGRIMAPIYEASETE